METLEQQQTNVSVNVENVGDVDTGSGTGVQTTTTPNSDEDDVEDHLTNAIETKDVSPQRPEDENLSSQDRDEKNSCELEISDKQEENPNDVVPRAEEEIPESERNEARESPRGTNSLDPTEQSTSPDKDSKEDSTDEESADNAVAASTTPVKDTKENSTDEMDQGIQKASECNTVKCIKDESGDELDQTIHEASGDNSEAALTVNSESVDVERKLDATSDCLPESESIADLNRLLPEDADVSRDSLHGLNGPDGELENGVPTPLLNENDASTDCAEISGDLQPTEEAEKVSAAESDSEESNGSCEEPLTIDEAVDISNEPEEPPPRIDSNDIAGSELKEESQLSDFVDDLKAKLQTGQEKPIKVNGTHGSHTSELEELPDGIDRNHELPVISHKSFHNLQAEQEDQNMSPKADEDVSHQQASTGSKTATTFQMMNENTSDSSASQQLVIDHAESNDQKVRMRPAKNATKRRRRRGDTLEMRSMKRSRRSINPQLEEKSLLLQRLQQPLPPPPAPPETQPEPPPDISEQSSISLSCFKCQANDFVSLQQFEEHVSICSPSPAARVAIQSSQASSMVNETDATEAQSLGMRYYRCMRCMTVHQSWNFFLHMRDVHKIFICLYCTNRYASVERLSLHLENRHDIDQSHYASNDVWVDRQKQKQQVRHLVCCGCQSTFESGSHFEDHDCIEQPCALCGQKGCHTNDCPYERQRKAAGVKRRRKMKAKSMMSSVPSSGPNMVPAQTEVQQQKEDEDEEGQLRETIPKLVVPKIMLRVPKEFQKSVDAELTSTDTEEDEDDIPDSRAAMAAFSAVPNLAEQAGLSEDTETATETASVFHDTTPPLLSAAIDDDDERQHFSRMLAEIERTKNDIERTKAEILISKKHSKNTLQHVGEESAPPRWSPTPPASPHNNSLVAIAANPPPPLHPLPSTTADIVTEPRKVSVDDEEAMQQRRNSLGSDCMDIDETLSVNQPVTAAVEEEQQSPAIQRTPVTTEPSLAMTHLEEATPPVPIEPPVPPPPPPVELQLDRPLDKFEMVDFIRLCIAAVSPTCLYCHHARRIAVNGQQLVLHLTEEHRFAATVDSITAEELQPDTIATKLLSFSDSLTNQFLNGASFSTLNGGKDDSVLNLMSERLFECFRCRFVSVSHKDLYTHNRRLHLKVNLMCIMCGTFFYSFTELLCHLCPGTTAPDHRNYHELEYRCCLCRSLHLPSAFRLMVHLRKAHNACDTCLEDCKDQLKLSSHVWKHKLLHLCYRCGISYRNKLDISKHLFWKHGTESKICMRCLQKRWRHVYHFCLPAPEFPCDQCHFKASRAIYLEVHKRMHNGDFRYACAEEMCDEKFVSRKLLLKHVNTHHHNRLSEQENSGTPTKDDEKPSPEADSPISVKVKHEPIEETKEATQVDASATETDSKTPKKRKKKTKRSKESLEDLNLIAPNLSESDSSDDSDSQPPWPSAANQTLPLSQPVDDLDFPKVMLSPSSGSDSESEQNMDKDVDKKDEVKGVKKETKPPIEGNSNEAELKDIDINVPKEEDNSPAEEKADKDKRPVAEEKMEQNEVMPDIWRNLLQNQVADQTANISSDATNILTPTGPPRPAKIHVAFSDHDYCKIRKTPPPSVNKETEDSETRRTRRNSSDSDSSTSSSSTSSSTSCSCGSNCSCSSGSSGSSSDNDSDSSAGNNDSQQEHRNSPQKRQRRKLKKGEPNKNLQELSQGDEVINVTSISEDHQEAPPLPQVEVYNESDFDSAVSETDEEFYDERPHQKFNTSYTQKRATLLASGLEMVEQNNHQFDIVENSRPSTPSLPEEVALIQKRERVKNKKKKRERKMSNRIAMTEVTPPVPTQVIQPMANMNIPVLPQTMPPHQLSMTSLSHHHHHHQHHHNQHHLPPSLQQPLKRMSEGSSCSDLDNTLKRSKRQRRPNKFYGYTSDDENMSAVLAPPLLVGMQLIKPQPPPQLIWAKEDLPSPARSRSKPQRLPKTPQDSLEQPDLVNANGNGWPSTSKKRKRRGTPQSGAGSERKRRTVKRPKSVQDEDHLPPIPPLKIRQAALLAATADSTDSSSADEEEEINVTTIGGHAAATTTANHLHQHPYHLVPSGIPTPQQKVLNSLLPPPTAATMLPPTPATKAFNQPIPPALLPNPDFATLQYFKANNIRYPIRPPSGARLAREGESVYCYCRCPYDEVSEMIACDGSNCLIEWFHFECVGIMVAPQGRWYCAECRPNYIEGIFNKPTVSQPPGLH